MSANTFFSEEIRYMWNIARIFVLVRLVIHMTRPLSAAEIKSLYLHGDTKDVNGGCSIEISSTSVDPPNGIDHSYNKRHNNG